MKRCFTFVRLPKVIGLRRQVGFIDFIPDYWGLKIMVAVKPKFLPRGRSLH